MLTSGAGRRLRPLVPAILVLALLVPAVPAVAETEACPTTIAGAGFRDLGGLGSEAVEAIDCVSWYGIAQGTSASAFSPTQDVPRWQMALFLTRTAERLGISLPDGRSQGFTDIGGLDSATRTAINQLAQLGITRGTAPGAFSPNLDVPRWQMALFLTRLLAAAGVVLPNGGFQGYADIGTFDAETVRAINQITQLGVARGTSTTTFDPASDTLRWHMALFLARSLEVGRASPYRVTVELSTTTASVSDTVAATVTVRDPRGNVVRDRLVDVFVAERLDSNGRCVLDPDSRIGGSDAGTSTNCTIDRDDPRTNSSGQVRVNITHTSTLETVTVHAWIGERGEVFDNDVVRTKASAQLTWAQPVTGLVVDDVTARFGTQVQVKARLVGAGGVGVAIPNQRIVFRVSRSGNQIVNQAVFTTADGTATLTYTGPSDPSGGDDAPRVDNVVAFWDRDGDGVDDGAAEFDDTATVTWDDDLPRNDRAVLVQPRVSSLAGSNQTVTITVTDKFGKAVSGARVEFVVGGVNPTTATPLTNSSGQASFNRSGAVAGEETIDARVDIGDDGSWDVGFGSVDDLTHYRVVVAGDITDPAEFDLIAVDAGANTIDVVGLGALSGQYLRLTYDSNQDTFNVGGQVRTMAQFESALTALSLPALDGAGDVALETDPYDDTPSGASTFMLTTS